MRPGGAAADSRAAPESSDTAAATARPLPSLRRHRLRAPPCALLACRQSYYQPFLAALPSALPEAVIIFREGGVAITTNRRPVGVSTPRAWAVCTPQQLPSFHAHARVRAHTQFMATYACDLNLKMQAQRNPPNRRARACQCLKGRSGRACRPARPGREWTSGTATTMKPGGPR